MSRRAELLAELLFFAGPLGPFTTLEEWFAGEQRFLAALDATALDDLLDILTDPDSTATLHRAHRPGFEELLEQAVTAAGRDCPERVLDRVVPLLDQPTFRPWAIAVLGSVGRDEEVALLDRLLHDETLTDDELTRVAGSLGDIGGPAAIAVLTRMRTRVVAPSVVEEIELALQQIAHLDDAPDAG